MAKSNPILRDIGPDAAKKIMQQTATSMPTEGMSVSNRVLDDQKASAARKAALIEGEAEVKQEAHGLAIEINTAIDAADKAGGQARALAIVTLSLLLRHELIDPPTKAHLSDTKGSKDIVSYLTVAVDACGMTWKEEINKHEGFDNTWRSALEGFVWLWRYNTLQLLTAPKDAKDHGKYAHLGLLMDKKGRLELNLDTNAMAAIPDFKLRGQEVRALGGSLPASAKEVITFGQELMAKEYWKRTLAKGEDVIGNFENYLKDIIAERKVTNPTLNSASLKRLHVVDKLLTKALEQAEITVAKTAEKSKAAQAELDKAKTQPPVTHAKEGKRGKKGSKPETSVPDKKAA